MKVSFDDFIKSFPSCKVLRDSVSARHIYDEIIWDDNVRIKMVEASDAKSPALSACAKEIEAYCQNTPGNDLDLTNDTVKQTIGRMVAVSIAPFGYTSSSKKRLSRILKLKYFFNATVFSYTGGETQRVVKKIVDC